MYLDEHRMGLPMKAGPSIVSHQAVVNEILGAREGALRCSRSRPISLWFDMLTTNGGPYPLVLSSDRSRESCSDPSKDLPHINIERLWGFEGACLPGGDRGFQERAVMVLKRQGTDLLERQEL